MKFYLSILCFFISSAGYGAPFLPAGNTETASDHLNKYEFRSFWLSTEGGRDWPPSITDTTGHKNALKEILHQAKKLGFNAVIFQVTPGGKALYPGSRLPWSPILTTSQDNGIAWDPLAFAIKESHKLGLELHAGYDLLRVYNQNEKHLPTHRPHHNTTPDPEWLESFGCDIAWINPAFPEAREWIRLNVMEIVDNYDIDGLHFDHFRYAGDYERDDSLMQLYNPANLDDIGDWRRENLNQFARELHTTIKAHKPFIKIGSTSAGHYQHTGGWAAHLAYFQYFQDSRKWLKEGYNDYIAPQFFHHTVAAASSATLHHHPEKHFTFTPSSSHSLSKNKSQPALNLPPRSPAAQSAEKWVAEIQNISLSAREEALIREVLKGNIPDYLRTLVPVTATDGNNEITFFVTPDYLSIGKETDSFLIPMTPVTAQKIVDLLDAALPTKKMVDLIWASAPLKLSPQPLPPSGEMTRVSAFSQHNKTVQDQRNSHLPNHPHGTLVSGTKKDVILSNRLENYSTPRVILYGWHRTDGSAIQPVSGVHGENYVDYSHGIRLISRDIWLNGRPKRLDRVLQDSRFASLLSDEGVLQVLRYPAPMPHFEWLLEDWMNDLRGGHYYPVTAPFRLDIKEEIAAQVDHLRTSGVPGHIHFSYRNISDNPFDNRYRFRSIVPPIPRNSMRIPNRVNNLRENGENREVHLTWEAPDPGRGESNPFFRYVIYREKESRIISDAAVLQNPENILDITGELFLIDTPETGHDAERFVYYVTALSRNNVEGEHQKIAVEVASSADSGLLPPSFQLEQNYPNPFNPTTEIHFQIPSNGHVVLRVFDSLGREVASLLNTDLPAGSHSATFIASGFSSGLYVYGIETGGKTMFRKMMLLK